MNAKPLDSMLHRRLFDSRHHCSSQSPSLQVKHYRDQANRGLLFTLEIKANGSHRRPILQKQKGNMPLTMFVRMLFIVIVLTAQLKQHMPPDVVVRSPMRLTGDCNEFYTHRTRYLIAGQTVLYCSSLHLRHLFV